MCTSFQMIEHIQSSARSCLSGARGVCWNDDEGGASAANPPPIRRQSAASNLHLTIGRKGIDSVNVAVQQSTHQDMP
jgi:hypothetical protein